MEGEKSYLENFKVGDKVVSPGRTVTEADIVLFAGISGDWSELHTNEEYEKQSVWTKNSSRPVNLKHSFRAFAANDLAFTS